MSAPQPAAAHDADADGDAEIDVDIDADADADRTPPPRGRAAPAPALTGARARLTGPPPAWVRGRFPALTRHYAAPRLLVVAMAVACAGIIAAFAVHDRGDASAASGHDPAVADDATAGTGGSGESGGAAGVGTAGSGGAGGSGATLPDGSPAPSTAPTVADLSALLLDLTTDGYELQPDQRPLTGPLTIHDEATFNGTEDPDALANLTALGYQRGYVRRWIKAGELVVLDGVHECAAADGAKALLDSDVDYYRSQNGDQFDVAGIPGAVGYAYETAGDSPQELYNVEFTVGARLFAVHLTGPEAVEALVAELGRAQYERVKP